MSEKDWSEIRRLGREAKHKSQAEGRAGIGIAIVAVFIGILIASSGGEAALALAMLMGIFFVLIAGVAAAMNTERNFAERDRLLHGKPVEPEQSKFDMTELYRRYPALPGAERARADKDSSSPPPV